MKTLLDTIVEHKHMEVLKRKGRKSLADLEKKAFYRRSPIDPLALASKTRPNIIAEFKRRSPSRGQISGLINPVPVVKAYRDGGALASSILTDRDFFGGSFKDLENVRTHVDNFPLLRKDFMIDPYQLHEAKAYGADIVLLIAGILDPGKIREMVQTANSLGLHILMEVHSEEELEKWIPGISMLGVNNRDLRNFNVDIEQSVKLLPKMPAEVFKISESGLHQVADVKRLYTEGFDGFLMGERFMKEDDPGQALSAFSEALNQE